MIDKLYFRVLLKNIETMVHCVAVNCNNKTNKKGQNTGVSFCRLPKGKALKEKWLINLKKENPPNDVRLCHLYFEDSCFKRDLEVTGIFCYFLLILMY